MGLLHHPRRATEGVRPRARELPAEQRARAPRGTGSAEADAPDGADVFVPSRAARVDRAPRRDLSGVARVEIEGERASVVTARGTRYPFRRRDNGIWGLTLFTAELMAEASARRAISTW